MRAFHNVTTHRTKSEQAAHVEIHQGFAGDAFRRGWNGWSFYSYYAPRGNAWNDLNADWNENSFDYFMVYPGPRGPSPTRISESVREGWEDFHLLTLLKQRALKEPRVETELSAILKAYTADEPLESLRVRTLRAAASLDIAKKE